MTVDCKKKNDDNSNTSTAIKDIDGNIYQTVTIGTQTWTVGNLKVTHYRNGDTIVGFNKVIEELKQLFIGLHGQLFVRNGHGREGLHQLAFLRFETLSSSSLMLVVDSSPRRIASSMMMEL